MGERWFDLTFTRWFLCGEWIVRPQSWCKEMNRWGTHGNYKRPSKRRGLDNGFNSGHRMGWKVEDIFTRKVNKIFRLFFQMKSIGFCLNKREKSQTTWFWGVKQLGKGNVKNRRSKAFCLFVSVWSTSRLRCFLDFCVVTLSRGPLDGWIRISGDRSKPGSRFGSHL